MSIVDEFMLWLEAERRYSPLTVRNYRRDADDFLRFIGKDRASFVPSEIRRADIEEWIIYLAEERSLAASSVNRSVASLRTLWHWMLERGYATHDVVSGIRSQRSRRRLPVFVADSRMADVVERVGIRELGYEKEAIYREIYAPIITPQPGLLAFLAEADSAGLRSAVGSSGYRVNVDFVLERCDIERYFSAIVAGDEVTRCKPDPEIYLTAAAKLGLKPSECIVFEDAEAGIEAAKRAGIKVVALATTFSREFLATTDADVIVDDFTQVNVEMLRRIVEA